MIRVHIFDWVTCSWRYIWRPVNVVRAMRHLSFGAVIACTGITIIPPSPPADSRPPPPIVTLPPATWMPPPSFPPPWGATPPESLYPPPATPIPLAPLVPQPPFPPAETLEQPSIEAAFVIQAPLAPLCPPEFPITTVVSHPMSEPAGILAFGFGVLILGMIQVLRRGAPVVPTIRVTILTGKRNWLHG